jgi:hypothetical protein
MNCHLVATRSELANNRRSDADRATSNECDGRLIMIYRHSEISRKGAKTQMKRIGRVTANLR